MRKKLMLFLLVSISAILTAQNNISGTITDQDSKALTGATIFLPEINKGSIADLNGNYQLQDLPSGEQKVQFSFVGYKTIIKTLTLSGSSINLNITLEQSVITGEDIVISGGFNSTQHENTVKIDILKLNGPGMITSPNFTQTLQKIPGLDMISKGSGVSKPVIRGLSMNDILVLNNGVRFENYQYSSHHPLGIDEFGFEEVEIIKGPASLLYGSDAIGGVLNFIKEKPAPVGKIAGDYTMQLFSNTQGATNNFGIKGSSEKFFGGVRTGQKTNADFLQGGGNFAPNSRFNEYSVNTNGGFSGKKGTIKIYYDYLNQKLGLVEPEAIAETRNRGRKNQIYYQQFGTHLISSQNKIFLGRMKMDVNSSFQNTQLIHFGLLNEYELEMKLATLIYETKLYLPSDLRSEYVIGMQGINQFNTNLNDRKTIHLPDAKTSNYSVFGLIQRTLFTNIKLQFGTRYDYKSISTHSVGIEGFSGYRMPLEKNYNSFSGSVGAVFPIAQDVLFRSNFSSAYRIPNLAELTSDGQHEARYEKGNENLVPENSYEADISLHFHKENFTFDLAGFYNEIVHYIFIAPTGDTVSSGIHIYQYMQKNSILYGGEAGLHIHPKPIEWMHIETTLASVIGKQHDGNYLPFIPANKLNLVLRAESEKTTFLKNTYISININSAFNHNNAAPDETNTSGYTLFNLGIGGNIYIKNQLFMMSISLDNLFDKKYIDHLSTLKEVNLFNPGRNASMTLKILFGK